MVLAWILFSNNEWVDSFQCVIFAMNLANFVEMFI